MPLLFLSVRFRSNTDHARIFCQFRVLEYSVYSVFWNIPYIPPFRSIISSPFHRIGSPKELMCQDELNVSEEEEVYEPVITWGKHDLLSRECFLPYLLKCLRLFSMSKYSIQRILRKQELVRKDSICTAIMNNGLKFFLYPDQFLGRVLKHRSSIKWLPIITRNSLLCSCF